MQLTELVQSGRTPRRTPLKAVPSPSPFQSRHASTTTPAKTPGRVPPGFQPTASIPIARHSSAVASMAAAAYVDSSNDTVKVVVRVRPLNSRELDGGERAEVEVPLP
jgi:hypothetical protein